MVIVQKATSAAPYSGDLESREGTNSPTQDEASRKEESSSFHANDGDQTPRTEAPADVVDANRAVQIFSAKMKLTSHATPRDIQKITR